MRNGADELSRLNLSARNSGVSDGAFLAAPGGGELVSENPATARPIAAVTQASAVDYDRLVEAAALGFARWRLLPAPRRGEIVRRIGDEFRRHKDDLGALISREAGKVRSEGLGEVQEIIDICDFAAGLSRQLYGLTMHSERPQHRMYEQWHPLGPIGVITAFNFPAAVWAWNAMIGGVCGDSVVWKPSPKTPLTAVAVQRIVDAVMAPLDLRGVFNLAVGGDDIGALMTADRRLPLVSFTGSVRAGRKAAAACARRLGRALLELGGNNAVIVTPAADLDLAVRAIVFSVAGTAGQRCTTTRRLFLHRDIAGPLIARLAKALAALPAGDPLDEGTLLGPLIDAHAVASFEHAVAAARAEGGIVRCGGARLARPGYFVEPTLIQSPRPLVIAREETFAPLAYVVEFDNLDEAIAMNNDVPQGLSSAIFTTDLREAEAFLAAAGSDCGIANVNIGTSGAEIGGAFGGEKDSGGGREAGADAWKNYMRRQTCTVNYGRELPLAQGVKFDA